MYFNDEKEKEKEQKNKMSKQILEVFSINQIKTFKHTPLTLFIQTAKDEHSCNYNLKFILEKIKNNEFSSQRGYFQFGLSLHNCCSQQYLQILCDFLTNQSQKDNYFKQPLEFWILISDGNEKRVIDIMNKLMNTFDESKKSKYIGYYSCLNTNIIKKFTSQQQSIISKAIQKGLESAPLILSEKELTFKQVNQDDLSANNVDILIETITCDLVNMQLRSDIQCICSPLIEEDGGYFYFDESTMKQHFMDKPLCKLINVYISLGIASFTYEYDIFSSSITSTFCELKFTTHQITYTGGKDSLKQSVQVLATEEVLAQQGQMVIEEEIGQQDEQNEQLNKPKVSVRGKKVCIDTISNILVGIEQNKYMLYEIPNSLDIPKQLSIYFSILEMQHKLWIHVGPHSITLQGYRKTVGRLIPLIYKHIMQIVPEVKQHNKLNISMQQNLLLPSTWEQHEGNLKLVKLDLNSQEAQQCIALFTKTYKTQFVSIERIQNKSLMKNYLFEKQKLLEKGNASEKLLFHGTRVADPQLIYSSEEEGFDFRLSKEVGNYGKGCYFHDMASYSHNYRFIKPNGESQMFIATVLIGVPYPCLPTNFTAPPFINGKNGVRYDSVMSHSAQGQNQYIVYHNSKSYPMYLITYK